jgi:hypothetical protein
VKAKVTRRRAKASEEFQEPYTDAPVLTWEEVSRTHRVRNGVYQRGERLVSLLTDFGRINPCYPDALSADGETIVYTGEGRHGDQHLSPGNRALLAAVESGHAVPLFNKLGTGRWQLTGRWRVAAAEHRFDEHEERMLWRFTLKKISGPEPENSKFKTKVQDGGRPR